MAVSNTIVMRRRQYAEAKALLASINKIKAPIPETRSNVMANLNRKRAALLNEIKRVSFQLWPETGRPS